MTVFTANIQQRLNEATTFTRDNIAQDIITGASLTGLAEIDAKGIFLLVEALDSGWNSQRDNAAKNRLQLHSRFKLSRFTKASTVDLIKGAQAVSGNATVQAHLTAAVLNNIYAAEKKRLSTAERWGIDGQTIGRGQLGQPAFTDVIRTAPSGFKTAWSGFSEQYFAASALNGDSVPDSLYSSVGNSYIAPTVYKNIYKHSILEDFVVAAYLALKMKSATKAGRSPKDAARFAVGVYHGMYNMLVKAQTATGDAIKWSTVEAHLRSIGHSDECDYVAEVII